MSPDRAVLGGQVTQPDRDTFYWERDRRSRQVLGEAAPFTQPVRIRLGGDAAETSTGQALFLSLLNMVCRVHRAVEIDVPPVGLVVPSLVPASDLLLAAVGVAQAINPWIDIGQATTTRMPTAAIGRAEGDFWLGANGYTGCRSGKPVELTDSPTTVIGASLSACFGSEALLEAALGVMPRDRRVSLWDFGETQANATTELVAPLSVGDHVAVIGAGAVGSALLYWLSLIGVSGTWYVVDGDDVELHNTNRSIGMLAADAGWPDGRPTGKALSKAVVGARLIGAEPERSWYEDWVINSPRLDLLIPAGGDREIRRQLANLGMPFLVQGATSTSWQAQLHRHIGADSCPACRFPSQPVAAPACSTGSLPTGSSGADSGDAALPFLSAAAGLLVVAALTQLETGYLDGRINQHGLLFGSDRQTDWLNTITRCRPDCHSRLPLNVRGGLNAGHKWASADR